MTMQARATELINRLKSVYDGDRFHFDFQISQYISGDHNKELRQEIIYLSTGERRPLTKCGMYATSDALKNKFDQPELF
jgi:hypothetical protein